MYCQFVGGSADRGVVLFVNLRNDLQLVFEPGAGHVRLGDLGVKNDRFAFGDLFLRLQRNSDVYWQLCTRSCKEIIYEFLTNYCTAPSLQNI